MKTTELEISKIKSVTAEAIATCTRRIAEEIANKEWVEANQGWLEEVGLEVHFSGSTILFYNASHPQVIRIIREIPGKWEKEYRATTISYTSTTPDYSRFFILCDSQPPGTCRMIPVVEIQAAHWEPEKVINTFKLQCREENEPGTADVEMLDGKEVEVVA
jgi:hypothetical protein